MKRVGLIVVFILTGLVIAVVTMTSQTYGAATTAAAGPYTVFLPAVMQASAAGPTPTPSSTPGSIIITPVLPQPNAVVGNSLEIAVTINATHDLSQVTAQVGTLQTTLTFTTTGLCVSGGGCGPGWLGSLPLASVPRGPTTLTITATDVTGASAQAAIPLIKDVPPVLGVIAPLEATVARPQLQVTATCSDDDPAGCQSLVVGVESSSGYQSCSQLDSPLATAQSSIDQLVSLAAYDGSSVPLCIVATDSTGQKTYQRIVVYVDSSTHLSEVGAVGGAILDVQPDRILFLENGAGQLSLMIHDRTSNQDTLVTPITTAIGPAFLTTHGAIFGVASTAHTPTIIEWRDGSLVNLGGLNALGSLKVSGDYAIWNNGRSLFRRNLATGTTLTLSQTSGNVYNDVAANGDVVYWDQHTYQIYRYSSGVSTQLTNDTSLWNVYPVTDGTNVAYKQQTPCCTNQTYAIMLYHPNGDETLAPPAFLNSIPGTNYQLSNGWAAFTKIGTSSNVEIWTRSPAGAEQQIVVLPGQGNLDALSPTGDLSLINGMRRALSLGSASPVDISSSLGYSFWQNGQCYVVIGRSVFQVNP